MRLAILANCFLFCGLTFIILVWSHPITVHRSQFIGHSHQSIRSLIRLAILANCFLFCGLTFIILVWSHPITVHRSQSSVHLFTAATPVLLIIGNGFNGQ
ncbi:hypothetical protein OUZ56_032110 [Daphnia magna]|uniref:Uncharacterized protein n=1 Tax=Daphnia magna TaxID=35525 RepID=A0ABQ9ZW85_9CRUS|nr:hypothetical protein OUZ56_032110 [Daphnia magna]